MVDNLILELEKINKHQGVLGSLIFTPDGMVVKSEVKSDFNDEIISAMASSVTTTIGKSLDKIFNESFSLYTISSTKGEILFINIDKAFLVILMSLDATVSMIKIDAVKTAEKIKNKLNLKSMDS